MEPPRRPAQNKTPDNQVVVRGKMERENGFELLTSSRANLATDHAFLFKSPTFQVVQNRETFSTRPHLSPGGPLVPGDIGETLGPSAGAHEDGAGPLWAFPASLFVM